MALKLDTLLAPPLPPGTKGLPPSAAPMRVGDIAAQGWNLLAGDVTFPAAVLKGSAVRNNLSVMQAYLDRAGMKLAPHGKTTLCPQLFDLQIESGAWGMTVATITQLALCHDIGVERVLVANELVGEAECRELAALCHAAPGRDYYVLVDSVAGVRQIDAAFAGGVAKAKVLIEIGMAGGRCGVRTVVEAIALARDVAALSHVDLCGIEGYEGLIVGPDPQADAASVDAYLDTVTQTLRSARAEGLFADPAQVILSAGGSVYYDLVARSFAAEDLDGLVPVIRSGCYVTHDSGFYRRLLAEVAAREAMGPAPALIPALEIWGRVLSLPEPGLAILSVGKRDVSFDIDLPMPTARYRTGTAAPVPVEGWTITRLSDQHGFMSVPAGAAIQVGDLVALAISHPCTTFDKLPLLFEVDDDYAITGGFRTFF